MKAFMLLTLIWVWIVHGFTFYKQFIVNNKLKNAFASGSNKHMALICIKLIGLLLMLIAMTLVLYDIHNIILFAVLGGFIGISLYVLPDIFEKRINKANKV